MIFLPDNVWIGEDFFLKACRPFAKTIATSLSDNTAANSKLAFLASVRFAKFSSNETMYPFVTEPNQEVAVLRHLHAMEALRRGLRAQGVARANVVAESTIMIGYFLGLLTIKAPIWQINGEPAISYPLRPFKELSWNHWISIARKLDDGSLPSPTPVLKYGRFFKSRPVIPAYVSESNEFENDLPYWVEHVFAIRQLQRDNCELWNQQVENAIAGQLTPSQIDRQ
ncbi:hypothetical protein [Rubripirellula tenax]|uniref:hypothetical protein n=1 Tax=Rubripirellula tenax TaxID=2528015 RepID=UPI0011B437CF|nr:hypothetical protein [Rubripirellula tenax]